MQKAELWALRACLILKYFFCRCLYSTNRNIYKQARKAHSSAFCIDLHWQTLMAMIGNDYNDGQWRQWRQWCHWRYRCFTHLPYLATLSWRQCLRTGTLPVPLRNLPQSQCFALALVGGHILQWRRQEIFRYFKIARILVNSGIVQNSYNFSIEHYSHILILSKF